MSKIAYLLGVNYPILLGAMRHITLAGLAAAVSNAGGFGQIASSSLATERLREEVQKARQLTRFPFGLNIPLHRPNALETLEMAAELKITAITTSGGNPAAIMPRAKALGLIVLHKVSNVAMGLKAQEAGADGVIATGFEAGGHMGKDQITTLCLVPQLVDALRIPVIASGGICDGRTFTAAFALGADAVEVGTRFLAAAECPVPEYYKQSLISAGDNGTIPLGHGKMSLRVLRNRAAEALIDPGAKGPSVQPVDYSSPGGDADRSILPAGMGAGLIRQVMTVENIVQNMLAQYRRIAAELAAEGAC